MKTKRESIQSRALRDVWEAKDKIARKTQGLSLHECMAFAEKNVPREMFRNRIVGIGEIAAIPSHRDLAPQPAAGRAFAGGSSRHKTRHACRSKNVRCR
jgi:hypothetical protein